MRLSQYQQNQRLHQSNQVGEVPRIGKINGLRTISHPTRPEVAKMPRLVKRQHCKEKKITYPD